MADWLADAVLYQIYPQSFADSNGDGIGDLAGVESKLDYLAWLGINTVWLNPCFASPMLDAGYDVTDYYNVAPRYGTNDDLLKLVDSARRHGIRLLLDLVPGHTSDQHPWFVHSANDPTDHRYIWADEQAARFEPSPGSRGGFYLPNYAPMQPALNFGYARMDAAQPWRQPVDADGPQANRQSLRDIMDHWLRLGVPGFRVDMAPSLIKDDPGLVETSKLWRETREWLDRAHPGTVLLSEWNQPEVAVPAGFDADFFMHYGESRAFRSLFHNNTVFDMTWESAQPCYFDAAGQGSLDTFLAEWATASAAIGDRGHIILPTANHDWPRLVAGSRTARHARTALVFQLTWPTLPAIYFGDEIGMQYQPGLHDHEGSLLEVFEDGFNRAGSRTPMQWDAEDPAVTYLPPHPSANRPNVADQRADPDSTLNLVRDLIALRKANPALGTRGGVEIVHSGYPFVYRRGEFTVVVNPALRSATLDLASPGELILGRGTGHDATGLHVSAFGYGIYRAA
jgi:glycosidase